VTEWFLNHKKSVGNWLLIVFKVSCFQTKLVGAQKICLTNNSSWFATLGAFGFNWFSDYGEVFECGGSVAHNL